MLNGGRIGIAAARLLKLEAGDIERSQHFWNQCASSNST